jgi:cystathionine beta-lyase
MLGKVTRLGIEATIAAWRGGAVWLSSVMDTLAQNRERLSYRLRRDMPQLGFYEPEATYLAWLDCHDLQLPDSPQAYFLERARVGLTDGGEFGPTGPGHVRLNFGTSAAILEQVLDRMAAAVARLPRGAVEYSEI